MSNLITAMMKASKQEIARAKKIKIRAYSTESGHPVQAKPDSQSTGKRTPSPLISDTCVGA